MITFAWLNGCPLSSLFCIGGGCVLLAGNGLRLLTCFGGRNRLEVWACVAGVVAGTGLAANYGLRLHPPFLPVAEALGHVGAVAAIVYGVLLLRYLKAARRFPLPLGDAALPSDTIWPPPPTT